MPSLLDLPAELRNQIYDLAFEPQVVPSWPPRHHTPNSTSLLLVNRQLYQETRLYPYQQHTFTLPNQPSLLRFVRALAQAQRQAVCALVFDIEIMGWFQRGAGRDFTARDLGVLAGLTGLTEVSINLREWMDRFLPELLNELARALWVARPGLKIVATGGGGGGWVMEL
jgi:hypothetical protein